MQRRLSVCARRVVATVVALVVLATSAWAQDYQYTESIQLLETRPTTATKLSVSSTGGGMVVASLPFEFLYYGKPCSTLAISAHGCLVPGATTGFGNDSNPSAAHGQNVTTGSFPYTAGTNSADGVLAPCWTAFVRVSDMSANTGYVYTWTSGTAPTRHFVVSWDSVSVYSTSNPALTIQVHLYEGSGRIVFAYSNHTQSGYLGSSIVFGLDSPLDTRSYLGSGPLANSFPSSGDLIFDPRVVTYTGTVLYDRVVSDATGIGNSVQNNAPAAGCDVELRRASDNFRYASAPIASNGTFSLNGVGVPTSPAAVIAVAAQNAACRVSTSVGGTVPAVTLFTSVSLASGSSVGTATLGSSGDPNGDVRAAMDVAGTCWAANAWASAHTSDPILRLDTVLDPSSDLPTSYQPASGGSASLRVASRGSSNPDAADRAIVTRAYAGHVLASIAAPSALFNSRFDAVTDTQNAFKEGFGYYVWAAVSGSSQAIDATDVSAATVYDLETPTITVTKGPDVAGCVAGALFDLVDGMNETSDSVDGTTAPERLLRAVDRMTTAPSAGTVLQAWADAGYDAAGPTRVFIGNKALADDAVEPNDDRTEAPSIGTVGVRRAGLTLNRYNEDWFSVTLLASTNALVADATYDRSSGAVVGVEIRDVAGALLATGSGAGPTGPIRATTGTLPAGTYHVGVRHVSGVTVATYTVQSYVPLAMDSAPLRDWTVARDYDQPLGVAGGITPYLLRAVGTTLPPGLALSPVTQHAVGNPTTPGTYSVTIELRDDGNPANVVTRGQTITINDELKVAVAPFVGFAVGKAVDTRLPTTGGTPPLTLDVTSGALPGGLAIDATTFRVTGTAAAAPSSAVELDGVDVAGSADHVATRGVVAVQSLGKNVPADLVSGTDACGWWFDAVQGSKVSFTAATAKKRAKRTLVGAVLAPDRSLVLTGKIKPKPGSLTGSGIVCPLSGRYYVVASSDAGDATQLLVNVKVAPPKSGKAKPVAFAPSDTTTIEVGALPGAVLTLKFAGQKKTTLVAKIRTVTDPTGTPVPVASFLKATATGGTLTMTLATGGTWTIVLGATSTSGVPGKLSYSYTIKQPKGVTYSAD